MITKDEIKQMDKDQLSKEITKEKQELLKLKLQTGAAQSKETHKLKELRRHIARMQTVKSSRRVANIESATKTHLSKSAK